MCGEVVRDAGERQRPKSVKARQFERIEDLAGGRFSRTRRPIDPGVVPPLAQREAIAKRPEPAVRGVVGAREQPAGVRRARQGARAGPDRFERLSGEVRSHYL
jgi:hypothetical protein